MIEKTYSIGELAKLSGVSVRRIRFYSDKGLLPPTGRTVKGYRVYGDTDVARLGLIKALRNAGVGLDLVRRVVARHVSIADVLAVRLEALEAEIASSRRVAAVLRTILQTPEPTEQDLRRLWTMTILSNAQFRTMIERFFDRVTEGATIDDAWKRQMIDASTPELPDDPSAEQIDAWNEIVSIITDESYIAEMRASAVLMWNDGFDPTAYAAAANATMEKVRAAIDGGLAPSSGTGRTIAREWLEASAKAMKREPDDAFLQWHLDQYRKYHARSLRYQELMMILRGDAANKVPGDEWLWINQAMEPLLAESV
jgi:DNA-binding transcriptional MerR regulator